MPRPQGGSGGRSSSGHSYGTRSTSGHRMSRSSVTPRPGSAQSSGRSFSQSSRPASGGFGPSRQTPRQGYGPGPAPRQPRRSTGGLGTGFLLGSLFSARRNRMPYGGMYDSGPAMDPYIQPRRRRSSGIIWIIVLVVLAMLVFGMCGCAKDDNDITISGYNREKIDNPNPYNADCIVDEVGFFENPTQTGQKLKTFYDKTGIQPEIVILDYNSRLSTDAQKEEYASAYYDKYISDEDTFLYMYFADEDPDEVGYMATASGKETMSVMDDQAVSIFWDYIDSEWTSDQSTDEMFVNVFDKTADRIMTKSTTGNDVAMRTLLVVGVVVVIGALIVLVLLKHKREREKAEETRRILETPLQTNNPDDDDLVNRYGG